MKMKVVELVLAVLLTVNASPSRAETESEWIALSTRIHGGFGAFIPVGIRIGLDAKDRLKTDPRGLSVLYYTAEKSPCPCIVDGIMLATHASPGQGTLQIAVEKAPSDLIAVAIIRSRKTGEGLRYTVTDEWLPNILGWNKTFDPAGRYQEAMKAEGLFQVTPIPAR